MPMYLLFLLLGSLMIGFGVARWWFKETAVVIPKSKRKITWKWTRSGIKAVVPAHYTNGGLLIKNFLR